MPLTVLGSEKDLNTWSSLLKLYKSTKKRQKRGKDSFKEPSENGRKQYLSYSLQSPVKAVPISRAKPTRGFGNSNVLPRNIDKYLNPLGSVTKRKRENIRTKKVLDDVYTVQEDSGMITTDRPCHRYRMLKKKCLEQRDKRDCKQNKADLFRTESSGIDNTVFIKQKRSVKSRNAESSGVDNTVFIKQKRSVKSRNADCVKHDNPIIIPSSDLRRCALASTGHIDSKRNKSFHEKYQHNPYNKKRSKMHTNPRTCVKVYSTSSVEDTSSVTSSSSISSSVPNRYRDRRGTSSVSRSEKSNSNSCRSSTSQKNTNTNSGFCITRTKCDNKKRRPKTTPLSSSGSSEHCENSLDDGYAPASRGTVFFRRSRDRRHHGHTDTYLHAQDITDDTFEQVREKRNNVSKNAVVKNRNVHKKQLYRPNPNEVVIDDIKDCNIETKSRGYQRHFTNEAKRDESEAKRRGGYDRDEVCPKCCNNSCCCVPFEKSLRSYPRPGSRRCRSLGTRAPAGYQSKCYKDLCRPSSAERSSRRHRKKNPGRGRVGSSSGSPNKSATRGASQSAGRKPSRNGNKPSDSTPVTSRTKKNKIQSPDFEDRDLTSWQSHSQGNSRSASACGAGGKEKSKMSEKNTKNNTCGQLSECMPMDLSHVQQLESLAEMVPDQCTKTLLRSVASMVEERIRKSVCCGNTPCCPPCAPEKGCKGSKEKVGKCPKGGKKGKGKKADCETSPPCLFPPSPRFKYKDRPELAWYFQPKPFESSFLKGIYCPPTRPVCGDRCWSNHGEEHAHGLWNNLGQESKQNLLSLGMKGDPASLSHSQESNFNSGCCSDRYPAKNTFYRSSNFLGDWSRFDSTRPTFQSRLGSTLRPTNLADSIVSKTFGRCGADPMTPCPHDAVSNWSRPWSSSERAPRELPNFYTDPDSVRGSVMGPLKNSLDDTDKCEDGENYDYTDKCKDFEALDSEHQHSSLSDNPDKVEKTTSNIMLGAIDESIPIEPTSRHELRESPCTEEPGCQNKTSQKQKKASHKVNSGSPRKAKRGSRNHSTESREPSATTTTVAELEARTNELLSESHPYGRRERSRSSSREGRNRRKKQSSFNTSNAVLSENKQIHITHAYSKDHHADGNDVSESEENFLQGFSPIKPPDVNRAYSFDKPPADKPRFKGKASKSKAKKANPDSPIKIPTWALPNVQSDEQYKQPEESGFTKQWWEDLPTTDSSSNSLLLKKYAANSAMPVSVKTVTPGGSRSSEARQSENSKTSGGASTHRHTTEKPPRRPRTPAETQGQGRSMSEPRSPANKRGGVRAQKTAGQTSQQAELERGEGAKKTGSYTVCRGRSGKLASPSSTGNSIKKGWKF